jgi:O-antigen/teichoic acid export membrane protein
MSLFLRFKKDYFNYLISIILPAFITSISVPVFKHLLGAKGYGNFSIYYNAALLCTAITTGWITQSIYRFYPSSNYKKQFAKHSIIIATLTQLACFLPILIFIWYEKNDLLLGILICIAIYTVSIQFLYMAITQSSFLSRKTIYSETIRSVAYIVIAVALITITPSQYLYVLFLAVIVSFFLSVLYLQRQTKQYFALQTQEATEDINFKSHIKMFYKYGAPLSIWFVFAYMLSYIDKILILRNIGAEEQGNYQAIFDLLSKGITVIITPVLISMFPLLTEAYEKREVMAIKKLLKKIVMFEILGFIIVTVAYWWFGANLLFVLLKVPDTYNYRLTGFIVIAGTFIWQIAMVMHKKYELNLRSRFLLGRVIIAFLAQILFYYLCRNSKSMLLYPMGFLLSALVYIMLVSFTHFRGFLNAILLKRASHLR